MIILKTPYWKWLEFDSEEEYKNFLVKYDVSCYRLHTDVRAGYTPADVRNAIQEGVDTRAYRIGIYYKGKHLYNREFAAIFGVKEAYVGRWRKILDDSTIIECLEKGIRPSTSSNIECTRTKRPIVARGVTWNSRRELRLFLNVSSLTLKCDRYFSDERLNELLDACNYTDRLKFPELAPYATWLFGDKWELVCPTCSRRLLVTTEELQHFTHSEEFCRQAEIFTQEVV